MHAWRKQSVHSQRATIRTEEDSSSGSEVALGSKTQRLPGGARESGTTDGSRVMAGPKVTDRLITID